MEKILITGTSSGIGLHLTKFFLEKNYQVYGISRSLPEINNKNYEHFYMDLSNLSNLEDNKKLLEDLDINAFIHNAGMIGELKDFGECNLKIWQEAFNVNLLSWRTI